MKTVIHSYTTRQSNFIVPSNNRLCRTRDGVNHFGRAFFNNLPHQFKSVNQRQFKRKVKNLLVRNAFQNYVEFLNYDFKKYIMCYYFYYYHD